MGSKKSSYSIIEASFSETDRRRDDVRFLLVPAPVGPWYLEPITHLPSGIDCFVAADRSFPL
jgi:hypothetical protein